MGPRDLFQRKEFSISLTPDRDLGPFAPLHTSAVTSQLMPPIDLNPRKDVTAYALWSKKPKAQDPPVDEVRGEEAPANGLKTPPLKNHNW